MAWTRNLELQLRDLDPKLRGLVGYVEEVSRSVPIRLMNLVNREDFDKDSLAAFISILEEYLREEIIIATLSELKDPDYIPLFEIIFSSTLTPKRKHAILIEQNISFRRFISISDELKERFWKEFNSIMVLQLYKQYLVSYDELRNHNVEGLSFEDPLIITLIDKVLTKACRIEN